MVLIDTPPLLAVSDALSLLPQVDGVVLVARVGVSQRPAAQRAAAAARLDPAARILGVVANDLEFMPAQRLRLRLWLRIRSGAWVGRQQRQRGSAASPKRQPAGS